MRTDLALAALASAAVPGMKPVAVAGIGPGDDGRASELQSALVEDATGRRWVVRAPLTAVAGARLQRNDELVRQLSRHVPFKVPAAVGYAPVGKDGSAAVYPHVEGSPLDLRRLPAGPGLASAVGRALAAVHNIPRAVFEEQDVPVFDASGARQRAIAEVDRAAETGRVPTGLLARWEEAFEAAPLWQFATTPVHGSFSGATVVVAFTDEDDAATGRVVAVTDWDESMVGDPAVDLAELWSQASRRAWEAVLDSYTLARAHRPDPYLHARARLVAELRNLRGLARAVADGDEEEARRSVETLRRVDRLTEADDSLVPVTARSSGSRPSRPTGAVMPVGADRPAQPAPADISAQELADGALGEGPGDDLAGHEDAGTAEHLGADAPPPAPPGDADPTMEVPPPTAEEPESTGTPSLPSHDDAAAVSTADEAQDEDATVQIEQSTRLAQGVWPDGSPEDRPGEATGHRPHAAAAPTVDDHPARPDADGSGTDDQAMEPREKAPPIDQAGEAATEEPDPQDPTDAEHQREQLTDGADQDPERGTEQHLGDEELDAEEPETEELEDEERLHELYGMPSTDRDAEDR